jgi:seryl-tRNA synthetase
MTAILATQAEFRAALLDAEVLVPTSVDGLYHRSGLFESLVRGVERIVSGAGAGYGAPVRYFPPVMPREVFERTDYLKSFPDLIGSIDTFVGSDTDHAALLRTAEAGGDWTSALTPAELMLCSAACHPLYPSLTGSLPPGGQVVECQGYVFRHEPSLDPARMQSFRQHEFVFLGDQAGALAHRDTWLETGLKLLAGLGLEVEAVVANDPFFGRAGRMLAVNQRETALKFEIVAPITSEQPTAITSANCHLEHFGAPFAITTSDGEIAHTACIGFGLERIALALLSRHGLDTEDWPCDVRAALLS